MVRKGYPELLELAGAVLVVCGLWLWAVPAALVTAGLILVAAANTLTIGPEGDTAVRQTTRTGRR